MCLLTTTTEKVYIASNDRAKPIYTSHGLGVEPSRGQLGPPSSQCCPDSSGPILLYRFSQVSKLASYPFCGCRRSCANPSQVVELYGSLRRLQLKQFSFFGEANVKPRTVCTPSALPRKSLGICTSLCPAGSFLDVGYKRARKDY